jgi:RNA polymerase sigma-70 factor (ECF subfamily)
MNHHPVTNPQLLLQLRDLGNQQAWNDFVRLYSPLIHGYCVRQGLQDADAWDVTQEVLASVCRAIGQFHYVPARGRFRSWLLTVTRRKVSDFFRRRRRSEETRDPAVPGKELESEDFAAHLDRFEQDYRRLALRWAAARVQEEVTERTWKAFVATAVDARSFQEVADELGMTVGAVQVAKCRSLARLRELIASVEEETDFTRWIEK